MGRFAWFILGGYFLGGYTCYAQEKPIYKITKAESALEIDGKLLESDWQTAQQISSFKQCFPYDTSLAQTKTIVKLTYDHKYLYVGAICKDTNRSAYVIQSLKRDYSYPRSDAFAVFIDPFLDGANGFSFSVNPYGVQREGLIQNGGVFGVTTSWDNRWESAVIQTAEGWQVEMAIPLKTIRFKNGTQKMYMNFSRNDLKINENSAWVRVPRNFNIATLAFTGEIIFDAPLMRTGQNIALIPYVASGFNRNDQNNQSAFPYNAGFDTKIAVGSNLNLDVTVNPDFSQVEVDRQVINVSRFSLFFPERRQFFIENSDLFASFGFTKIRPFFSRQIGLGFDSSTFAVKQIPIPYGLRLSGKINQNWRIGLMNIQTLRDSTAKITGQNYSVFALQRRVFNRSNIAFIALNKQPTSDLSSPQTTNRILGIDFNIASKDNKLIGKLFSHHSFSNLGIGSGNANASWLRYDNQIWALSWNHEYVHEAYRAQVGFVPRASLTDPATAQRIHNTYFRLEPSIYKRWYPKTAKINKITFGTYYSDYMNQNLESNDRINELSLGILFLNSADLLLKISRRDVQLNFDRDITFSGQTPLSAAKYNFIYGSAKFISNRRKTFFVESEVRLGDYYNGSSQKYFFSVNKRIQPTTQLSFEAERNRFKMPYISAPIHLDLFRFTSEFSFTKQLFFTTFLQYNTQAKNVNLNARFQYRFKPMSDLFLVYTNNYTEAFYTKNKALVLKLNYWFNL